MWGWIGEHKWVRIPQHKSLRRRVADFNRVLTLSEPLQLIALCVEIAAR
jgi:hypothetical protein